jgi:pimeloyl-ACP methyl ester carboxylesterase
MEGPSPIHGPTSHIYYSQRLRLHYVDWGNAGAPPMLLVQGGRDHCRNWDWVAESFRHDYHIIAPDLRGHGDSQWNVGGAYMLTDYIYDIAQLLHQTQQTPVTIISHSLGAAISLHYAGIYTENVTRLVAIEGMGGPPHRRPEERKPTETRLAEWVGELRKLSGRQPRRYPSLEDAYQRMQEENPHLSPDQSRHLTVHGVSQNEDGTYSWKFDNYVRPNPPFGLRGKDTARLWGQITCPTLLVRGTESWASDPNTDGRIEYFQKAQAVSFEGAGHWVHHDQFDAFVDRVRAFLADTDTTETIE